MNKFITKIAALSVGLAMAIGVGIAVGGNRGTVVSAGTGSTTFNSTKTTKIDASSGDITSEIEDIDSAHFTVTYQKNGASNDLYVKKNDFRMYGTKQTYKGNYITVSAASGYTITTITFGGTTVLTTAEVFAGSVSVSSNHVTGTTATNSGTTYTINSSEFTIYNNNSGVSSNTQVKFGSITINYETSGSVPTLQSVALSGSFTKTSYSTDESWDPTGLVVTGTYSDASTDNTLASSATFTYYSESTMTNAATPSSLGAGSKTVYVKATVSGISNSTGYGQAVTISVPSYTDVLDLDGKTVFIKTSDGANYIKNDLGTTYVHPSVSALASAQAFDFALVGNDTYTIKASGGTYDGYYLSSNGSSGSSNKMFYSTTSYSWKGLEVESDLLLQDGSNNYLTCYNTADWRCYSNRQSAQKDALEFPDATSVTTYDIAFNHGTNATGEKEGFKAAAGDYTLPDSTGFTPSTGYIFVGWKANNAGDTLEAGSNYTISGDVTFYAQWAAGIGLVYNANTGSGNMDTTYVLSGGTQTVASCSFESPASNKVFDHWNTSSNDDGISYNPGDTITNYTSQITLYAIWEEADVYTLVTDPSTLTDGTTFVLVGYASDTYRIASGLNSGHEKMLNPITSATTISNGLNEGSTLISGEADVFTLVDNGGAWEIKRGNTFLQFTGTSNGNDSFTETSGENTKFTISGDASIDIISNSQSNRYWRYNTSTGDLRNGDSSYGTNIYMFAIIAAGKEVVNSKMTSGTVSASTGDNSWTLSGFSFEVLFDGDSEYTDVTGSTTFTVTESVPTITASGTTLVHVVPTYHGVTYTQKQAEITATLTFIDFYSISRLYDIEIAVGKSYSTQVTFDGIYMGESGGGIILMNGAYGMLVYGASGSSYTAGETYLTVTGTLKNYNYLYEIDSGAQVSPLSDTTRRSNIGTPSTYVVTGEESSETLYLANRKTSLSGTVYSVGGNTTAGTAITAGSNNSVYVTVGGTNILLYIKSAQATADLATEVKVGASITVEGFTTYYKNNNVATFEVMFTDLVEGDENYHAADFARDLLKLTLGTCNSEYDGITSNASTLTGIWTTLAGADYWLKVQANGEDADFIGATPDSTIVVPEGADAAATRALIDAMSDADALAAAAYRYDYCTAKYELTNFTNRTLTVSFAHRISLGDYNNETSVLTAVIVVASLVSLTAVGGYFFLRKRKEN